MFSFTHEPPRVIFIYLFIFLYSWGALWYGNEHCSFLPSEKVLTCHLSKVNCNLNDIFVHFIMTNHWSSTNWIFKYLIINARKKRSSFNFISIILNQTSIIIAFFRAWNVYCNVWIKHCFKKIFFSVLLGNSCPGIL